MKKINDQVERLKPLSLYPLKVEEALGLFMRVDPVKAGVDVGDRWSKRRKGDDDGGGGGD